MQEKRNRKHKEDTIAAIATPVGEGGIGIVRLSGPSSLKIADRIFISTDGKKPSSFGSYTVHYGRIVDRISETVDQRPSTKKKDCVVDEVILTVMRAPKSYTKEDIVEINCHGGIQALKKTLDLVVSNGARVAEPGEFTKRAFLNGRIDLARAEAVLDVIRAKTEGSLKVAMNQLDGILSKKIAEIREELSEILAHVEASIDFPDEEIEPEEAEKLTKRVIDLENGIRYLSSTYSGGAIFREGVLATICGKPNVGKSSLMNLLLKRDRVIVSPVPGTTRDAVEEMISIGGIPIRLVDTAGISETKDFLGSESVRKSKIYLDLADIAILVLDGSTGIEDADRDIVKLIRAKTRLVLVNKCDMPFKTDLVRIKDIFKGDKVIEISVKNNKNIDLLEKTITDIILGGRFIQSESAIVSNARHKELLDKSLENVLSVKKLLDAGEGLELVSIDLKEALYNIGLIIGMSVSEDILDRIFEQFCIGK